MKRKSSMIFCFVMFLFCIMTCSICYFVISCNNGVPTPPSPTTAQTPTGDAIIEDDDGFPEVDWGYWQGINSDVIGWITIPGTDVNYPILRAWPNDRDYYLSHNVYKDWDVMGAVHLDADCFDEGLSSKNVVLLGHSLNSKSSGAIFTPLIQYKDEDFARSHTNILIQTPEFKKIIQLVSVQNINGNDTIKMTSFNSRNAFYEYQENCFENSEIKIEDSLHYTEQMFTLCTCSYFINPSNERILLYGK